ncbi:MAG: Coenzyme F420 hydrogenase/dehydrogenase, beta subunit C-terminal domain [Thermodesulfobacteriota bacterium]
MNTLNGFHDKCLDIIDNGYCIGCGACINLCPYKDLSKGKAVSLFSCPENSGKCDIFCPQTKTDHGYLHKKIFNETNNNPPGKVLNIYKSRAGKKSGAGSNKKKTVTALNLFIIDSKIVKKTLLTKTDKDFTPVSFFAETQNQILNSGSTNYCSSSPIAEVNKKKEKNYAFTGLPCHIRALAKMECAKKEFKPDYLPDLKISLFCSWSLDPEKYTDYLNKNFTYSGSFSTKITSDNKPVIIFQNDSKNIIKKDLEDIRPFIRKGCALCTDLTGEYSDISVGDCENDDKYNILIARTQKGLEIINNAANSGYIEIENCPENDINLLEKACFNKKQNSNFPIYKT